MTTPRRRAADLLLVPLLALALAVTTACSPSITPAASQSAPAASPVPSLTPVPGGPSSSPDASITLPTTTQTDFGVIWDALPPSFPRLPGQIPTDPGGGPTSGAFALGMDVATASAALSAALTAQGWTVDAGTSLEDGSVVIEIAGPREGCVGEVRLTPLSGTVSMSVLYGAECPFS